MLQDYLNIVTEVHVTHAGQRCSHSVLNLQPHLGFQGRHSKKVDVDRTLSGVCGDVIPLLRSRSCLFLLL